MNIIEKNNIDKNHLKKNLLDLLKEQFNIRLQLSSGKLKKTHLVKKNKKDIARIKTVLNKRINHTL
ncbi:50S ribosomal protein L29 [Buchnera aphidicola]|uniref:Large ribosomal subunit protein uL29 n=2 Tax=Buchnera aphidicola (Cinara cedri) TaxID=261318 RepID=RL29_BUCCC|nr:50S ribosomal protein L29 [Buchnera aphidicola]Q057B2.1 RecName: Full=Large ribosomal subunit protein uL29; AltName: Full=50S ribosomal protein L29 [Buchnera aphidicola BCc]AAW72699.1 50S ribosomal protein L29 [Buchnera aphidicola (Cinara cedri)]ABJ90787.1 50S ribosomal protein L29 [Buchnera aphidicola BCc]